MPDPLDTSTLGPIRTLPEPPPAAIHVLFADNGNIRKWSREPFDGSVRYVAAPERYLEARFRWAAPGDQQEDAWLVRFCDKDCGEAIFTGPDAEREAWEHWNRYAPSYNIYVFRLAALSAARTITPAMIDRAAAAFDQARWNEDARTGVDAVKPAIEAALRAALTGAGDDGSDIRDKADSSSKDAGDRPALTDVEITPQMIEAGILAVVRYYDPDADGLDNLRTTVLAVLSAAFDASDYVATFECGVSGELS